MLVRYKGPSDVREIDDLRWEGDTPIEVDDEVAVQLIENSPEQFEAVKESPDDSGSTSETDEEAEGSDGNAQSSDDASSDADDQSEVITPSFGQPSNPPGSAL